jgi:CBS domain-containing protein
MLNVRQILAGKSLNTPYYVHPDQTVLEALELMSMYNIGVVLVMESDRLVGIFSERDYARKGIIQGRKAGSTPVSAVMTADVVTVSPGESIDTCMQLMSQKKFRHLPVMEQSQVVGVVSISDIVTAIIREQESRIQSLEQYITGG